MRTIVAVCTTAIFLFSSVLFGQTAAEQIPNQGPFGFRRGMTKDQVLQLVGGELDKEIGDVLKLKTAPNPHRSFESYTVLISPQHGLLKILATGRNIQTNGFGSELRNAFLEIQDAVAKTYGKPSQSFDYVRAGSLWQERQYWMMGLLKKERTLTTYWTSLLPNQITNISLDTKALSTETGYVSLSYEFEGFEAYVESNKAKERQVF